MAYDANHHGAFSERMKNIINQLQSDYEEAGRLDAIYTEETASGTDPAFVDNGNASAAEHVNGITLLRRLRDCLALDGQSAAISSEDQTANMTPFLQ